MEVEPIALTNAASQPVDANASSAGARKNRTLQEASKHREEVASPNRATHSGATEETRIDTRESDRSEPRTGRDLNPLLQNLFRSSRLKLDFRLDEETQRVVITVIDPETQETVRQVPPEEILRLAEKLDSVRGAIVSSEV
jgi:flagellar protein FlaG